MVTRDLAAAREAHATQDTTASRLAHLADGERPPVQESREEHIRASAFVKSFIFGGLDGIITTFAVVAGASGGDFSTEVVLALGLSSLFADALSMGVGDALSSKSEMEAVMKEREREEWEFDNFPEGEIKEMVDIYVDKGLQREDAEVVMNLLSKYKDVFLDLMVKDELGLDVPDEGDNPWMDGLVTFSAFLLFGFVPLFAYVALSPLDINSDMLFLTACILTGATLFALGAIKSSVTKQSFVVAGLETLALGGAVAAVSFLIGWAVSEAWRM